VSTGIALELLGLAARHPAARPGSAPALLPCNLQLAAGEALAVIGPSGAGKTTLLQALAGIDPWALPRSELQALRGRLFLAPQVPPLPPRQRVVTAVLAGQLPAMSLWQSLRSLVYPHDIPAAFDALERFDLAEKLFERVDRLSGGERQRVGLARALLAPAGLWLVDEPLSALDPARARQAMATLRGVAQERGLTLVATLHQVEVALQHFPRVLALRDGAVAFDLPAAAVTREHLQRLYHQHEHELQAGSAPAPDDTPAPASAPAVMHCR
jgi:phosphonate transport system ATP-binding protein